MLLGKRKRDTIVAARPIRESQSPPNTNHNGNGPQTNGTETFRKFFEQTFSPLDLHEMNLKGGPDQDKDRSEANDSDSGWEGLSGDSSSTSPSEDEVEPEIILHQPTSYDADLHLPLSNSDPVSRREFMSSKPPPSTTSTQRGRGTRQTSNPNPNPTPPDPLETLNLQNDTLLHRLLHSSSLLNSTTPHPSAQQTPRLQKSTTHNTLKDLLRTLDPPKPPQEQAQKKMPLSHRQGMQRAQSQRESRRRTEAREAGIVLARPEAKARFGGRGEKRKANANRVLGRGDPGVGRFERGSATLRLSERDVRAIQGSSALRGSKGRERGGGRGRKRGK